LLENSLSSNTHSNTIEAWNSDSTTAETHQRTLVEGILDKLNDDIAELVTALETGGFDHLEPDQQVAVWQRFERLRNKLPLVDPGWSLLPILLICRGNTARPPSPNS
jgi:hypothetical protein